MLYCSQEVGFMTEQNLQAIRAIMKEELEPVNKRLDSMDERLDSVNERLGRLEESQEEVRDAVNALLEWSDKVSESFQFPLPRL